VWEVQIRKLREVDRRGKGEELEGPKKELLCARHGFATILICALVFSHPNTFRLVVAVDEAGKILQPIGTHRLV
jgi:hypothetical protein